MGIQPTAPHAVVQLVDFIGDRIFSSLLRLSVDFGINLCAPGRVDFLKVFFIQLDYSVEVGFSAS